MTILFISILYLFHLLFLWSLLIVSKRSKSEEEEFEEDNLQMLFLKNLKKT